MDHVEADPTVDREVRAHFAALAAEARDFAPELVIIFGPDHFKGVFYDMMPPFTIGVRATAIGDYDIGSGDFNVPERAALDCVSAVRSEDIDVALSYRMQADHGSLSCWCSSPAGSIPIGFCPSTSTAPVHRYRRFTASRHWALPSVDGQPASTAEW